MFDWLQSAVAIKIIASVVVFVLGWTAKKMKVPVDNKRLREIVIQVVKGGLMLAEDWKQKNQEQDGKRELNASQKVSIHGSAAREIAIECRSARVPLPSPEDLDLMIKGVVKEVHEITK